MAQPCLVCHYRHAETVCAEDRRLLAKQLTDIPEKLAELALHLMPGNDTDGPCVATSRVEAPLPVRLDALSLLAAGSEQVTSPLHPLIRRWSVATTIRVQTVVRGETTTEQRRIQQWFSEPVHGPDGTPVLVPDDDQIGSIPPREWLDMTVRAWRSQLGHHVPARTTKAITARLDGENGRVTIWPAPRPPPPPPRPRPPAHPPRTGPVPDAPAAHAGQPPHVLPPPRPPNHRTIRRTAAGGRRAD